jgi:CRP-like cAMP-binding protein
MTLANTLRTVPLLSKLRDSDLEILSGMLVPRDYPKNRVILFSHDAPDAFYLVQSGQVKVMLIAEDGREVVLSLVGAGDFFGETSLMDDEVYSSSVIAMEDSRLLVLHRDHFRRCIAELPGMSYGLLRALCARLREADDKIGGLMLLDVAGRVSHLLLELADRAGSGHIQNVPTHQVIAQMVGSSRETVSRTFSALSAQGQIETSRGGVTILNRESLESAAGNILRRRTKNAGQNRRTAEPSGTTA